MRRGQSKPGHRRSDRMTLLPGDRHHTYDSFVESVLHMANGRARRALILKLLEDRRQGCLRSWFVLDRRGSYFSSKDRDIQTLVRQRKAMLRRVRAGWGKSRRRLTVLKLREGGDG